MHESQYITAIHKKLPPTIYRWKINTRFTNGVPDTYYSGPKGDLWVEYKFEQKLGKKHKPNLSNLQLKWLKDRHSEGRRVAVIIGSTHGAMIIENRNDWARSVPVPETLIPNKNVAHWIKNQVS